MAQTAFMSSKRKQEPDPSGHKPRRMAAIKGILAKALQAIIDRNASDFTTEVNRAVREMCEREGTWPLKPAG